MGRLRTGTGRPLVALLLLAGCPPTEKSADGDTGGADTADTGRPDSAESTDSVPPDTTDTPVDLDGDGYRVEDGDCDDGDPAVYPGAQEICTTAADDDCDGDTNDPDAANCTVWFADADGDGLGATDAACLCAADAVYNVATGADCDDADPTVTTCHDAHVVGTSSSMSWPDKLGIIDAPGDVDGDGVADLMLQDSPYWLAEVPTSGEHRVDTLAITTDLPGYFADAGDGDGDGLADYAWIDWEREATEYELHFDHWITANIAWGALAGGAPTADVSFTWFVPNAPMAPYAVALGGDLDADGAEDVFFVAGYADTARPEAFLIPGGATGTLAETDVVSLGEYWADIPTAAMLPGDIDGDGIDDLLGGSQGYGYALTGPFFEGAGWNEAGTAVEIDWRAHGDLDGDGYRDVVATAWSSDGSAAPTVCVLTAPWVGTEPRTSAWLTFEGDRAELGGAALLDVDGDGTLDLVAAAPDEHADGIADGGVYVLLAPAAGAYTTAYAARHLTGPTDGDDFGASLAALGDRDGDGAEAFAVGSSTGLWVYEGL